MQVMCATTVCDVVAMYCMKIILHSIVTLMFIERPRFTSHILKSFKLTLRFILYNYADAKHSVAASLDKATPHNVVVS